MPRALFRNRESIREDTFTQDSGARSSGVAEFGRRDLPKLHAMLFVFGVLLARRLLDVAAGCFSDQPGFPPSVTSVRCFPQRLPARESGRLKSYFIETRKCSQSSILCAFRMKELTGNSRGVCGFFFNWRPTSSGRRFPFKLLIRLSAKTQFSHEVTPPRDRGTT